MAGFDLTSLLPLMMGGGKNLNPQDLMSMMMRGGGGAPPRQNNAQSGMQGNMQMNMMMQMISMMSKPQAQRPAPVGFRPLEGICPVMPILMKMLQKKR